MLGAGSMQLALAALSFALLRRDPCPVSQGSAQSSARPGGGGPVAANVRCRPPARAGARARLPSAGRSVAGRPGRGPPPSGRGWLLQLMLDSGQPVALRADDLVGLRGGGRVRAGLSPHRAVVARAPRPVLARGVPTVRRRARARSEEHT